MSKKYQAPRGTNDLTPGPRPNDPICEIHRWQQIETTFAELVELHGYHEIRTPVFEDYDLFVRSSGDTSDIVSKEMYDFMDKGERHIALKPEGTAPVLRAYIEHNLGLLANPTRLWYFTPSFRYGRPGKGRYRQLHQLGLELLGTRSPRADAEIVMLAQTLYAAFGLEQLSIFVNNVGTPASRQGYREAILAHLGTWLADQSTEDQAKARKNPLRLLDSKDPDLRAILADAPSIEPFLTDESRQHFDDFQTDLADRGIPAKIDRTLVRGLDYYTDTVFEIVSDQFGTDLSLCGGGRYDNLVKDLGGPETPAVGVGIGVERLLLTLEQAGYEFYVPGVHAYIATIGPDEKRFAEELAYNLRSVGLSCVTDLDNRNLKGQMKQADKIGASVCVVLAQNELDQGFVTVKDLETGDQSTMPLANLPLALQSLFTAELGLYQNEEDELEDDTDDDDTTGGQDDPNVFRLPPRTR